MPDRVLWTEGLLIAPQHLQLWDLRHQQVLWALVQGSLSGGGGFFGLELDYDALTAGHVALRRFSAIFGDGSWVDAPDQDDLPDPRPLPNISSEYVGVFLGLPVQIEARHRPAQRVVVDAYGDHLSREVEVGRPRLLLSFDGERQEGLYVLKVGELVKRPSGTWEWSGRYVPPLMCVKGSEVLMGLLRELQALIEARRRRLMAQRAQGVPREMLYSDAVALGMLCSLNGLSGLLDQALEWDSVHPERLYAALRERVATMTTYGDGLSPADLPGFRLGDLHGTYRGLLELMGKILNTAEAVHAVRVPLRGKGPNQWLGDLHQQTDWEKGELLLTLTGVVPDGMGTQQILDSLKVAAPSQLDFIVSSALRGVDLQPLARPPAGVIVRPGTLCLKLLRRGHFWEGMVREHEFSLYMPNALTALTPELVFLP